MRFPFFSSGSGPEKFLSKEDNKRIVEAIRLAEMRTSGEVRVFLEKRCRYVNPVERAAEVFFGLKMDKTEQRNGVLVYVAYRDRQFAIFADEGIYREMGKDYWHRKAEAMLELFSKEDYVTGMVNVVNDIGEALYQHFPYNADTDKNELPDDIVFGR